MVKIGIISDIHANLEGLELALNFLKAQEIDTILCAGDLVERGENGDDVVRRIQEEKIPVVMGNHDMLAQSNQEYCLKHPRRFPNYQALCDETFEYLATLPRQLRFQAGEMRLYLTHGAPWDVEQYIFVRQPPAQFKRVLQDADAEIVILGHTHQPMMVEVQGMGWILNAGSCSSNYLPDAILMENPPRQRSCGILNLAFGPGGFEHCDFKVYDLDTGKAIDVPYRKIE